MGMIRTVFENVGMLETMPTLKERSFPETFSRETVNVKTL